MLLGTIAASCAIGIAAGVGVARVLHDAPQDAADGFNRSFQHEAARLRWPGRTPEPPPYVPGSPSEFGKEVAQTRWLCEWARMWLGSTDGVERNEAIRELATWRRRSALGYASSAIARAVDEAAGGDGATLAAFVRANCVY